MSSPSLHLSPSQLLQVRQWLLCTRRIVPTFGETDFFMTISDNKDAGTFHMEAMQDKLKEMFALLEAPLPPSLLNILTSDEKMYEERLDSILVQLSYTLPARPQEYEGAYCPWFSILHLLLLHSVAVTLLESHAPAFEDPLETSKEFLEWASLTCAWLFPSSYFNHYWAQKANRTLFLEQLQEVKKVPEPFLIDPFNLIHEWNVLLSEAIQLYTLYPVGPYLLCLKDLEQEELKAVNSRPKNTSVWDPYAMALVGTPTISEVANTRTVQDALLEFGTHPSVTSFFKKIEQEIGEVPIPAKDHEKPEIFWRYYGTFAVQKMWEVTKREPDMIMSISDLKHNLDKDYWTLYDENKKETYVAPNQVLANPALNPVDYQKILEADLSYSIIVYKDGDDLDVIDGLHRLAKTIHLKKDVISVKMVTREMVEKGRISDTFMGTLTPSDFLPAVTLFSESEGADKSGYDVRPTLLVNGDFGDKALAMWHENLKILERCQASWFSTEMKEPSKGLWTQALWERTLQLLFGQAYRGWLAADPLTRAEADKRPALFFSLVSYLALKSLKGPGGNGPSLSSLYASLVEAKMPDASPGFDLHYVIWLRRHYLIWQTNEGEALLILNTDEERGTPQVTASTARWNKRFWDQFVKI